MSLSDVVESNQEHVTDLREELGRVRAALDRTDAVLGVADETLERAEVAIKSSRTWGPIVLAVLGAAVIGAGVVIVMRKRRHSADEAD
jgi:hypothetical protein